MVRRAGFAVERAVHRPCEALQDGAAAAGGVGPARHRGQGEALPRVARGKGFAQLQAAFPEHAEPAPFGVARL